MKDSGIKQLPFNTDRPNSLSFQILLASITYLLLIHILSFFYFNGLPSRDPVIEYFIDQFYFLIACSLLLSLLNTLLIFYFHRNIVYLLLIQWITLLILGYPLGSDIFIETLLFSGLVLQIVFQQKKWIPVIIYNLLIIFTYIIVQHKTKFSDLPVEAPDRLAVFMQAVLLTLLAGLFSWLKYLLVWKRYLELQVGEFKTASDRLIITNRSFQEHAYNIEKQSIEQERQRLSRELHDIIGYTMVSISMMMEDAIDKHARNEIDSIFPIIIHTRDIARETHQHARDVLRKFRNNRKTEMPFDNQLFKMARIFSEASGVEVNLTSPHKPPSLSQEYSHQILRIIQEGLTNALHHGKAEHIDILITYTDNRLCVTMTDDGVGAEHIKEGIGISGMRERLKIVNGTLSIHNMENSFSLTVFIPVPRFEK